jgi:hypothetical protein
MTSYLAGGSGLGGAATLAATGHPVSAGLTLGATGLGMAGNAAFRAREASMRASGTEAILRILQSGRTQSLGRYAGMLETVAARGGPALAARHLVLYQRDPEYRRMVEELPDEEDEAELPVYDMMMGPDDTAMAVE